jgi:hypothetical protein
MTFSLPTLLAHGALGIWDEMIFLGVVVIFVAMMGISWARSRFNSDAIEDDAPAATPTTESPTPQPDGEHFKLE